MNEAGVQSTNDDAQSSKLACTRLGYFHDDFVHLFAKPPVHPSPLINRGYYCRFAVLRALLLKFLASGSPSDPKQVLILGAGFDTTFFQLVKEGTIAENVTYVELDFKTVTARKAAIIAQTPQLHEILQGAQGATPTIDKDAGKVESSRYHLLPCDLRHMDQVEAALRTAGIDFSIPTFILAECVLVYMPLEESTPLVSWLASHFDTAAFAILEQVNQHSPFGNQMIVNLKERGCPLLGILPSLEAHNARLIDAGWSRAETLTMGTLYNERIDLVDRRRAECLEMFDEFEEWNLIQSHYCVALGVNDTKSDYLKGYSLPKPQQVVIPQRAA